jgi:hypothetical protein
MESMISSTIPVGRNVHMIGVEKPTDFSQRFKAETRNHLLMYRAILEYGNGSIIGE